MDCAFPLFLTTLPVAKSYCGGGSTPGQGNHDDLCRAIADITRTVRRYVSSSATCRLLAEDDRAIRDRHPSLATFCRKCDDQSNRQQYDCEVCCVSSQWPVGSNGKQDAPPRDGSTSIRSRRGLDRQAAEVSQTQGAQEVSAGVDSRGVSGRAVGVRESARIGLRNTGTDMVAFASLCGLGIRASYVGHAFDYDCRRAAGSRRILLSGRAAKGQRGGLVPTISGHSELDSLYLRSIARNALASRRDGRNSRPEVSGDSQFVRHLRAEGMRDEISSHSQVNSQLRDAGWWKCHCKTRTFNGNGNAAVSRSADCSRRCGERSSSRAGRLTSCWVRESPATVRSSLLWPERTSFALPPPAALMRSTPSQGARTNNHLPHSHKGKE